MKRPVLLWDVMGTLVHDPFFQEMPEFFGLSFHDLLRQLQPGAWVEFELGRHSEDEFLKDFFADRRNFDHAEFIRTIRQAYRWLPGMEDLLAELREAGYTMHTFSNYPEWYRMIEDRLAVSRFARWSFVSCLTGFRKPDRAAYAHVLSELRLAPDECIFVDDRPVNCAAACETGMRAIEFEGAEALREALRGSGAR